MAKLAELIVEVRKWRADHVRRGAVIEAAACAIREQALLDAMRAVQAGQR